MSESSLTIVEDMVDERHLEVRLSLSRLESSRELMDYVNGLFYGKTHRFGKITENWALVHAVRDSYGISLEFVFLLGQQTIPLNQTMALALAASSIDQIPGILLQIGPDSEVMLHAVLRRGLL